MSNQPFDKAQDKPFGSAQGKKLIFDIETIGVDFENLDKLSQEYLLKYVQTEEEIEKEKKRLALWPLTGEIVAIGILNPDTNKGAVYFQAPEEKINPFEEQGISFETGTEKEIIEKFWQVISDYQQFISFNGRSFDAPFLMIRSAILGIRPTKNLLANRYLSSQPYNVQHIDLFDQLSFYGVLQRKFSFHLWAKAFGIKSPKEDGLTGESVKEVFNQKKYLEIARYNLGDLIATKELYDKWQKYLSF